MWFDDRRAFLKAAGLASAALAAEPASAQDDPPKPSPKGERLRVAVIGAGGRGGAHIQAFAGSKFGTEVVALCDADQAAATPHLKAVEQKQGKPPAFQQDLRTLLDDKSIDAVAIATPNHWHTLAAIWAMQAGKHVYVEKPVSHNMHESEAVVYWARRTSRLCQHGSQSRSSGAIQQAVKFVRDGGLGWVGLSYGICYKRRSSIGKSTAPSQPPKSIDYDLWCGPAPLVPPMRKKFHYDWHWQWAYGNGDLGNQGIHQMDVARWFLGNVERPQAAVSVGGRLGYIDDGETANTQMIAFDYGDHPGLLFEVRGLPADNPFPKGFGDPKKPGKRGDNYIGNLVLGSKGLVAVGFNGAVVALSPAGDRLETFKGGGDHFRNFADAVREKDSSLLNCEIAIGAASCDLCHLGNISHRLGKPGSVADAAAALGKRHGERFEAMAAHLRENGVDLAATPLTVGRLLKPGERGKLAADDEAALQTREYRKPYVVNIPA